ncbi:unnamed protein product [Prunus armeniaca]|uniref:6-phosphogluconate dehydrogenase NADP-binding domain-containing protein n=1 Tax=Prunus armeniaca TaxID=36596 RepID=A0A6J5TUV8_PRUAR|nr:unnamed protein product [Prunus armeniaca]
MAGRLYASKKWKLRSFPKRKNLNSFPTRNPASFLSNHLLQDTDGNSLPKPHFSFPNPHRLDWHRRHGSCHGLPPSLSRLLPHHLRSHSFKSSSPPIPRCPTGRFPISTRSTQRRRLHNGGTPTRCSIKYPRPRNRPSLGLRPNSVSVDMTSSHPALAREIFNAARAKDCWTVDAPVSGGDIGAREGKLAILAGGDASVVEWLAPVFDVLGKVTYVGPAGSGQNCKIANQIVVGGNLVGLSEGLVFAERAGLDVQQFMEAVRGGAAGSMVMELFGDRIIGRDFRPGGFAEYMVKDLGMGVDVVEENEEGRVAVLPGAALCKQLFSGMVANGDGKLGGQGLITVIERLNGK